MSKIVGYTTGVFDLFHIGHLNIIKKSKLQCDELIVGVSSDRLVEDYKGSKPIIPCVERIQIISALSAVDRVIEQTSLNKMEAWKKLGFNVLFHGNDWKGSTLYNSLVIDFKKLNVDIVFFEYTDGTSSTQLKKYLNEQSYK
jgi:glycerol-3-phosphate cytidylyltransferase